MRAWCRTWAIASAPVCALYLEYGGDLWRDPRVCVKLRTVVCCLLHTAVAQTIAAARRAIAHRTAGRSPCRARAAARVHGRVWGRVHVLGDMEPSYVCQGPSLGSASASVYVATALNLLKRFTYPELN